jgi:acetyl esterase
MFNRLKVWLFRWYYRFMNRRAWKRADLSAVTTRGLTVGEDIPAREYRAGDRLLVIFFHGGGWTIGDLDTHDPFCRRLAQVLEGTVVALDYRLAPEHRFPAAADDCLAGSRWILDHRDALGAAAGPVLLAGDSAGGNLAAVVANALAPEQPGAISGQLLIYPAVRHCTPPTISHIENGKGHELTYSLMVWFWKNYLGEKRVTTDGAIDPLATPLNYPLPGSLPPALVITAGLDPLRDEGADYAQKLAHQGVPCVHEVFTREIHGFVCSKGLTPAHQQAMELIRDWALGLESPPA